MGKSPGWKALGFCYVSSWHSCLAAPALADLLRTSPCLQVTCGQSQQCLMTCCCLAFSKFAGSVLFPRDGSLSSRKTKPVSDTAVADLAEAMLFPLPACQPARSLAELPLPSLESWWCDSPWVQTKCYWADFTATALFLPDGRSRARELQVDVCVWQCCSFCLGVLSLLPWSFFVLGRAAAP